MAESGTLDRSDRTVLILAAVLAAAFVLGLPVLPFPGGRALFKCAPILLLALLCLLRLSGHDRWLATAALIASALGDVLLELDRNQLFLPAMAAFFVTQVLYIALLLKDWRWCRSSVVLALLILLADLLLVPRYWLAAPALLLPGTLYLAALTTMAITAGFSSRGPWLRSGGLLFFVSDHLIASNQFLGPLPWAQPAIMLTYYAAQGLIAGGLLTARSRTLHEPGAAAPLATGNLASGGAGSTSAAPAPRGL